MDPQQQAQIQQMSHLFAVMMPMVMLFGIVVIAIYLVPLWKICTKAGLAGPLSLIALIPGIGTLIVLYIVAFSKWHVVPTASLSTMPYPPQAYPPTPYPPAGSNQL